MANKKTVALTRDQVAEIISAMRSGGAGFRKNDAIATALHRLNGLSDRRLQEDLHFSRHRESAPS